MLGTAYQQHISGNVLVDLWLGLGQRATTVHHLKPLLHVLPTSPVSLRQVEKQKLSLINKSKVDLLTALLCKLSTHCIFVPDEQVSYIIRGNNEKKAAQ